MPADQFREEEFSGKLSSGVTKRILSLLKPHLLWVTGFLVTIIIVSILDAFFTYLSKQIVDQGILAGDTDTLYRVLTQYGSLILVQAAATFGFVFLVGVLEEFDKFLTICA